MRGAQSTNPFDAPSSPSPSSSTTVRSRPSSMASDSSRTSSSSTLQQRRPAPPPSVPIANTVTPSSTASTASLLISDEDEDSRDRKLPTDINERFMVLVERYRDMKEKTSLLKKAYRAKQSEVDALNANARQSEVELRKAQETAEQAQFNYNKLTKQVKSLQIQIKEEKEKASQGGWFSSGAKADLERCKGALVAARGELRRKIQENEHLHKEIWEKSQEGERSMQLLRDKIHSMNNEIRELHESDEIKQKIWEEQKRELRAAKEDSDRQWAKTEEERERTLALLNETKAALARMTQSELLARESLARMKAEVVMFDDGSPLSRFDAPSTCYVVAAATTSVAAHAQSEQGTADDGWKGIIESHRGLGASFSNKSRVIEASWNTYGGGGDEDVSLRTSVRALWAWSGRATPAPGLSSIHALRRMTLALASLKLRPVFREAALVLQECLHGVTRAIIDCSHARTTCSAPRGVHASSRPHLARRYETLLEQLRDAYRETRSAWASFMLQEASCITGAQPEKQPSTSSSVEKALEACISSCGTALALARQMRSEQEAGKAFARGRAREGSAALASGWALESQQAASFLGKLNQHGPFASAQSVPYETALENARYLISWQSKEAQLVAANAALQAQLEAVTSEKERIAEQWARTTDQLRQQRAQLSRMALEENQSSTGGSNGAVTEGAPSAAVSLRQQTTQEGGASLATPPQEGSWKVRRVPGAGTGDDDEVGFGGITRKTRQMWEARVTLSEAEAAKWHSMYVDLMRAAAQDKEERQSLQQQVTKTEQVLGSWNEEKDALHRGYQDQLLVLNDHLIKQTELISQKDNEITLLQSQRVRCVSCGGWNTVGWLLQNGGGKKCKYGNHPSGLNYALNK